MLHFHIAALFATAPEPQRPRVFLHLRCLARAARFLTPVPVPTEAAGDARARLVLVSELAESIATEVAGLAVTQAADKLARPTSAPLGHACHAALKLAWRC